MPNREGANTLMRRNGWSEKLIASWGARAAFRIGEAPDRDGHGTTRGLIRLVFPTGLSECVHDLIHVLLSSEALKRLFETQQVGVGKVVQVH